jgi:peptide/nickel transport system substrate-binding protein
VGQSSWNTYARRRLSRRTFVGGAFTAAGGAAFLAACGGDDDEGSTSGAAPAGGARPAAQATTAAPGRRGGTLRISGPAMHPTFDPANNVTVFPHLTKVYSHLVVNQFSTGTILHDSVSAHEQPDPQTLRFTLRDGMTFHDGVAGGRAVTAEDAAYSINRIRQQAGQSGPLAASNLTAFYWGWIDRAEAPDAKTLVIRQAYPYGSNLATLGAPGYAIVAKEVVEANAGLLKADNAGKDAGAGPYTLTQIRDDGYTWERWPKYWKHTNPPPTFVEDGPYIDKIEFRMMTDPAAIEAAFRAGDLDMIGPITGQGTQIAWDKAKAEDLKRASGVKIAEAPSARALIANFDMSRWDDQRLRQAVSLAIDRDALIRQVYLGDGVVGSPIPLVFKDLALAESQLKDLQKTDARQAKQLWDAAGGNQKFREIVMITSPANPLFLQITTFIAEELRKALGATVKIDAVDIATYNRRALDTSQPTKDWDFFITTDPFLMTVPDANMLSTYVPSGYAARNNFFKTDATQPAVAELAKKIQTMFDDQLKEADPARRKTKLQALQTELLTSYAPGLPIPVAKTEYLGYRDVMKNLPLNDYQYLAMSASPIRVHDLWLDRA